MTDNATGAENQQERLLTLEQAKWFLAGFIEGEGGLCVSIKVHPTARFGYYIQPGFFLYQRQERRELLELAQQIFGVGGIWPKPGNEVVLVYAIMNRSQIMDLVIPYYERYMPYMKGTLDYQLFKLILKSLINKDHLRIEGMLQIVDWAYRMNIHAKSKGRKRTQAEVVSRILRDYTPDTAVAVKI